MPNPFRFDLRGVTIVWAASTGVNCNSHFFFRDHSADRFFRLSDCPGQGSENHPDFSPGRKAFSELILN